MTLSSQFPNRSSATAASGHRNSGMVGNFVVGSDETISCANDIFLEMVGYAREDLPIRWEKMTPPEFRNLHQAKLTEIFANGTSVPWEEQFIRQDRRRVSAIVGVLSLRRSVGKCTCFCIDTTGAAPAEEARRRGETRRRAIFDDIPLLCFTVDQAGTVCAVNKCGAEHLGYEPGELVHRPLESIVHMPDWNKHVDRLETSRQQPGHVVRGELRLVHKSGTVLWTDMVLKTTSQDSDHLQAIVVCDDVMPRKLMDEKLAAYQQQLRALSVEIALAEERERRRLAAELHDEVGHGLAIAKIKASGLRQFPLPVDGRKLLDELSGQLDDTITATRQITVNLSSALLFELGLVAALKNLANSIAADGGLQVHIECDPLPKLLAEDSRIIIYRSVKELLVNVIKHARAKNLCLTMQKVSEHIQITVEDDGVGFEPTSVHAEEKFGLLSVQEQIGLFGGRFDIDSSPDGGTRATVVVPILGPQ